MDRANKAALEKYPKRKDGQTRGYVCDDNDVRRIYAQGYRKAEKDLALTWEDVNLIDSILVDLQDEGVERYGGLRQYYEEALKRINEQKKI